VGRHLWHAALVGAAAGLAGAALFALVDVAQRYLLEDSAGYLPLLAEGEKLVETAPPTVFRPWLLVLLPAVGALLAGVVSLLAPETRGGGGDAMIESFHHHGGQIRRRAIWVKALASLLTLGTGGSGGREGPTMQIGGGLGSWIGSRLNVGPRERRILMVAGVAAGISAVFRTPLGASLLAIEVLYRDDFESDALVPCVLASVIAYSIVISIFGESTLFARSAGYPFVPSHLPLFGLLALPIALVGALFTSGLRWTRRLTAALPGPVWLRPGLGGLALGGLALATIVAASELRGLPRVGLGILGSGYGAAQMAITGSDLLPAGWGAVELLLFLCGVKLVASCLTIGTGGSAGDFAPSLVLGALFGGAFGHAARLLFEDPRIDPGAFALVGMGTLYGGIAHVPVSALILVCELAGNYDLLVPLMLSGSLGFVLMRRTSLYDGQVQNQRESPAHPRAQRLDVLESIKIGSTVTPDQPFVTLHTSDTAVKLLERLDTYPDQAVFPVLDDSDALAGLIAADSLRFIAGHHDLQHWTIAEDLMHPPVTLRATASLRHAAAVMMAHGLREVPVTDEEDRIIGFVNEADLFRSYLDRSADTGRPGG
jgi:CIC family chloride channel protein